MKTGKSISQFDPQSSLTGDEWLLVNKLSNGNYISKKVRMSTLKDFILGYEGNDFDFLITEYDEDSSFSETPIITYDGDNIVCEG